MPREAPIGAGGRQQRCAAGDERRRERAREPAPGSRPPRREGRRPGHRAADAALHPPHGKSQGKCQRESHHGRSPPASDRPGARAAEARCCANGGFPRLRLSAARAGPAPSTGERIRVQQGNQRHLRAWYSGCIRPPAAGCSRRLRHCMPMPAWPLAADRSSPRGRGREEQRSCLIRESGAGHLWHPVRFVVQYRPKRLTPLLATQVQAMFVRPMLVRLGSCRRDAIARVRS